MAYRRGLLSATDSINKVNLVIQSLYIDHKKDLRERELSVYSAAVASGRSSSATEAKLNQILQQMDSLGCGCDVREVVESNVAAWFDVLDASGYMQARAKVYAARRAELMRNSVAYDHS